MEQKQLSEEFEEASNKQELIKSLVSFDKIESELETIKGETAKPEFWQESQDKQTKVLQRKVEIEKTIERIGRLITIQADIKSGLELLEESDEFLSEVESNLGNYRELLKEMELQLLLNDPLDKCNAIVSINPGAGGVESQDWAQMLFRMYSRWAEQNGYRVKLVDITEGAEAGIKSALFEIIGDKPYGYLKNEAGVHRLVRISPFDSAKRRHTSFASVVVTAEIDDRIEIEILDKDLKIDTLRASGSGGQHVNVTDSAVRITHIPSGIVVKSQVERSQHKNKQIALKILRSQLYKKEIEKKQKQAKDDRAAKMDIEFGSQIRSYVLYPYQMVKDHRSSFETSATEKVLDGDINSIIQSSILAKKSSGNPETESR